MDGDHELFEWQAMSPEEKKQQLFLRQKATLDSFLERGAISQAQYDKSYSDMISKMNIQIKGGK
jgi:hypothetical protein